MEFPSNVWERILLLGHIETPALLFFSYLPSAQLDQTGLPTLPA